MQAKQLFALAMAAVGVVAERCGAPEPTEAQLAKAKSFLAQEQAARLAGNFTSAAATIEVNVYFHVVAASSTTAGGYLSVRRLSHSIQYLPTYATPDPSRSTGDICDHTRLTLDLSYRRATLAASSMP